ncbi:MutS-related protein [Actinocorallia sp. A-T 12471]|uniref:MutS-related protein n=1 Tax=Actinocorallia sp. A-T 12471 TaxID=3089813 RepID=UPI0029CD2C9D|nr:hypothetical protein [Actinocorallia sp. A-T 12471]MDX6740097.1 hypothetical protein [Actinocorallia sp. A-T 12471]
MRGLLGAEPPSAEPGCLTDLRCDVIAGALAAAAGADAAAYLRGAPRDPVLVAARQAVFRALEDPALAAAARRFCAAASSARRRLDRVARTGHVPQAGRRLAELVADHAAAVEEFAAALRPAPPGLTALAEDLAELVAAPSFTVPRDEARALLARLAEVRYDVLLRGDEITVVPCEPGQVPAFADRARAVFARFHGDGLADPPARPADDSSLDVVEAAVLDLVAEVHPSVFADVAAFHARHRAFLPEGLARLDRDLRFCLGYLDVLAPLRDAGLPVCYPDVSVTDRTFEAHDLYDLALAVERSGRVVPNDVTAGPGERVIVVSGPNQGGKTTLSRAFGQLHHLAGLGCPVPARRARVFLPDRVLTHYERAESLANPASRLQEEQARLRALLAEATGDSVVVLNEIFMSTTSSDALALSRPLLDTLLDRGVLCLWVTFLDELSRAHPSVVSMVAETEGEDARRTYRIVRGVADGQSHARTLAERYGLTYEKLSLRLQERRNEEAAG